MLGTADIIQESSQQHRLNQVLPDWLERPLYRKWGADVRVALDLARIPLVTKQDLRTDFPLNFLSPEESLDALLEANTVELEFTSGTSEDRVPVLLPRGWWDAQEERALRLNPVVTRVFDEYPSARRVTLTTPVCNGQACPSKWLTRVQRSVGRTLYVNHARIPFLLTEDELEQMAREISEWEPQFLDLDPVHGAWFALYCERRGWRFPSLRFILCSYEFASVVHRRIIQRVFGVPVLNLYGATETGHLLMEGADGRMLASRETAFLELIESDERNIGQLVVTSLSNDRMPLVRYRIGDLVEAQEQPYCTTYRVHGRARDALRAADGRRVTTWDVDQFFVGVEGIAHYQLRQAEGGEWTLRYVPETANGPELDLRHVQDQLAGLTGQRTAIATERVDTIVPAQSGKFRLTCPV
jgi:phenylacetate-CoA ligase